MGALQQLLGAPQQSLGAPQQPLRALQHPVCINGLKAKIILKQIITFNYNFYTFDVYRKIIRAIGEMDPWYKFRSNT